jgi:cytosine/adenosine deaminase-related metal-dependent hydrolase
VTVYSADWVLPVDAEPIRDGAVAVEDGRIAAVGPASELGRGGRRFESAAIVPGFVNAHSHLEYAVYAGFGDGVADFSEWITLHIERKARIGWDEFVAVARAGAAECLRSGITTVADASYSGAAAFACDELGLRAVVYLEVFGSEPEPALERFHEARTRVEPAVSERVRLGVSPHAPYSATVDVYRACAELGLPVATHLSETAREVDYLRTGVGDWGGYAYLVPSPRRSGPQLLAEHDVLGPEVVAAHCVVVDDADVAALAATGTGVAHCPRSNALLGCGIAPLRALLDAGVSVGLGTDSPASAPSFDMFDELRVAVAVARARERRADALSASEALELATLGSARALGLGDEIGSLVPGKRADLAILSLESSPYLPWEDPATAIVFGGSPDRVLLTLVDGEPRYEKGVNGWHELIAAASSARGRMLAAAPPPHAPEPHPAAAGAAAPPRYA